MTNRRAVRQEDDVDRRSLQEAEALRVAVASPVNLPEPVDLANVAEAFESLAISQLRELSWRYRVLLVHLPAWQQHRAKRSRSRPGTIHTQPDKLARLLEVSTGPKPKRAAELARDYRSARAMAAIETAVSLDRFPARCPYRLDEVAAQGWWPPEPRG